MKAISSGGKAGLSSGEGADPNANLVYPSSGGWVRDESGMFVLQLFV